MNAEPIPGYWPRALRRTALRVVLVPALVGLALVASGVGFLPVLVHEPGVLLPMLPALLRILAYTALGATCTVGLASVLEYAALPRLGGPGRSLRGQVLMGLATMVLVVLSLPAGAAQVAYVRHVDGSFERGTLEALAAAQATGDLATLAWTLPVGAVLGAITACRLRGPASHGALLAVPLVLALGGEVLGPEGYGGAIAVAGALLLGLLFLAYTLTDALEAWRWPLGPDERAADSPLARP